MIGLNEVNHMKSTLIKRKRNQNDEVWVEAFSLYNKEASRPLALTCPACYYKVLKYHIDKTNEEGEAT